METTTTTNIATSGDKQLYGKEETRLLVQEGLTDQEALFCELYFTPGDTYLSPGVCYQQSHNRPDLEMNLCTIKGSLLLRSPIIGGALSLHLISHGFHDLAVDHQLNKIIHETTTTDQSRLKAIELYNRLKHRFEEAPLIAIQQNHYTTNEQEKIKNLISDFEEQVKRQIQSAPAVPTTHHTGT